MPFKPGDFVRPREGFRVSEGRHGLLFHPLPKGRVARVSGFGLGQVILIDGTRRWELSGQFELDEDAG